VLRHADFVGSTRKLLDFVQNDPARQFIIGTESGILHTMAKAAPDVELIPAPVETEQGSCASCSECPYMKLNTLEKMVLALQNLEPRIELDEDLRRRAERPLRRMLELS
jgi:quinolinate synthase